MRMKYALCFKLRAFGRKTTSYQIRMRVSFSGQRVDELSGWNLETPEAWDESGQRVRPGYVSTKGVDAETINQDLDKMREVMDAVFSYYTAIEVMPSVKDVDARFREKMGLVKTGQKTSGAPRENAAASKKKEVRFLICH